MMKANQEVEIDVAGVMHAGRLVDFDTTFGRWAVRVGPTGFLVYAREDQMKAAEGFTLAELEKWRVGDDPD